MNTPMKRCSSKEQCVHPEQQSGGWLPATREYFHWHNRHPAGLNAVCKDCASLRSGKKRRHQSPTGFHWCSKCSRELPETPEYFYRDKGKKSGLSTTCKTCTDSRTSLWVIEHPERIQEIAIHWRRNHRDRTREHGRLYRENTPKGILRQRRKRSREQHPERERNYGRHYRQTHRERRRELSRRRYARQLEVPYTMTASEWSYAQEHFNGCCAYCGHSARLFDRSSTLHQEHFIPITAKNTPGTVPTNIVPACQTCNTSKNDSDPYEWIDRRFGKRKANVILKRIHAYFNLVREQGTKA